MKNILNFRGFFLVFFQKILLAVLNKTAQTIEMVIYLSEPFRVKKSHVIEEKLKPSKNFFFCCCICYFPHSTRQCKVSLLVQMKKNYSTIFCRQSRLAHCARADLHNGHAVWCRSYTTGMLHKAGTTQQMWWWGAGISGITGIFAICFNSDSLTEIYRKNKN